MSQVINSICFLFINTKWRSTERGALWMAFSALVLINEVAALGEKCQNRSYRACVHSGQRLCWNGRKTFMDWSRAAKSLWIWPAKTEWVTHLFPPRAPRRFEQKENNPLVICVFGPRAAFLSICLFPLSLIYFSLTVFLCVLFSGTDKGWLQPPTPNALLSPSSAGHIWQ